MPLSTSASTLWVRNFDTLNANHNKTAPQILTTSTFFNGHPKNFMFASPVRVMLYCRVKAKVAKCTMRAPATTTTTTKERPQIGNTHGTNRHNQ